MKSKCKVLFMLGTHAATCDRVVIFLLKKGLSYYKACKLSASKSIYKIFFESPQKKSFLTIWKGVGRGKRNLCHIYDSPELYIRD